MKNTLFTFICFLMLSSISLAQTPVNSAASSDASSPVFAKGKMTVEQFFDIYLRYPEEAVAAKKEGTVLVTFTVEADGEVTNATVRRGVDELLDAEALRVVSLFPYYTPAKLNGENVKTELIIPVKFQLAPVTPNDATASSGATANDEKYPLYVIDDKIVNDNLKVDAEEIESIRVMKGSKAIEKYGERASDGVIIITTKRITPRR